LGYLPTIGGLIVELADYDFIDRKKKPKFTIDTSKALELLQGAGLYDGAYQRIREILQNAVDATLLRFWIENENE
jgi:HSP90 family molecular chaperone